jgi:hypothetical protein
LGNRNVTKVFQVYLFNDTGVNLGRPKVFVYQSTWTTGMFREKIKLILHGVLSNLG